MTTIWVDCAYCDDPRIQLRPADIFIELNSGSGGVYWFWHCGRLNMHQASNRILDTLVAAGVHAVDPIQMLRDSDERVISSFSLALDMVDTPADIGWVS